MGLHVLALDRMVWHDAELSEALSAVEFAAARRFCALKTRPVEVDGLISVVQVLCTHPGEAEVAVGTIQAAAFDARRRLEIEERDGHLLDSRVATTIAQAAGS